MLQDKLPVVVFTLSRNKCDKTVDAFTESLLSHQEQMYVKEFFKKSVKHLKGTDSQLPQVLKMQKLLRLGIGVHHSGILPILKEIVEMLFQKGIVKVSDFFLYNLIISRLKETMKSIIQLFFFFFY